MECWKRAMGDTWGSSPGGQGSLLRMFNTACVTNAAVTDGQLFTGLSASNRLEARAVASANPAEAQC